MIAEAIDRLQKLFQESQVASTFHPPAEPEHVYYLVQNGQADRRVAEPPPRANVMFSPLDLVKYLGFVLGQYKTDAAIFVGRGLVTAVLNERGDRRDQIIQNLALGHAFIALRGRELQRTGMTHRAFLQLLRIDLAGCIDGDSVELFRSLKLSTSGNTESSIRSGKESLGKAVASEALLSGKPIPEELPVALCVYEDLPDRRQVVKCAVVSDLQEMTFALIPLAGELDRAQRETDTEIAEGLRQLLMAFTGTDLVKALAGVQVFCGQP